MVVAAVGLLAAGFIAGDALGKASGSEGGRMVYGRVSDVRPSTSVVCVHGSTEVCARLFRGDLPPSGAQVRGWLVEMPYDVDNAEPDLAWAFVTVLGSG